jgi:hypothetical protein
MKKTISLFVWLFVSVFCFTNCVTSEYIGIETKVMSDHDALIGTWEYQRDPKAENEITLFTHVILKKGTKTGEYALEIMKKAPEGEEQAENLKLMAYVGKIKNTSVISFGGMSEKRKRNEFYTGIYRIEGDKLIVRLLLEKDAVKDGQLNNNIKPTVFKTQKAIQDFVNKNITSETYLSKEVIMKKQS